MNKFARLRAAPPVQSQAPPAPTSVPLRPAGYMLPRDVVIVFDGPAFLATPVALLDSITDAVHCNTLVIPEATLHYLDVASKSGARHMSAQAQAKIKLLLDQSLPRCVLQGKDGRVEDEEVVSALRGSMVDMELCIVACAQHFKEKNTHVVVVSTSDTLKQGCDLFDVPCMPIDALLQTTWAAVPQTPAAPPPASEPVPPAPVAIGAPAAANTAERAIDPDDLCDLDTDGENSNDGTTATAPQVDVPRRTFGQWMETRGDMSQTSTIRDDLRRHERMTRTGARKRSRSPPRRRPAREPPRRPVHGACLVRSSSIVMDTCALLEMDPTDVVQLMHEGHNVVHIPLIVVVEIDGMVKRVHDSERHRKALILRNCIERWQLDDNDETRKRLVMQRRDERSVFDRFAENSDAKVLNFAIYLRDNFVREGHDTPLLLATNDRVLRIKCHGEGIATKTSADLFEAVPAHPPAENLTALTRR